MAEQNDQRQVQIRIDESKMQTVYANTVRTSTTQDEVILDFGLNLPMQAENNQMVMLFGVGSRVVMNWQGAKRLAMSLAQVVRTYEQRFGEININQGAQGGSQPNGGPRIAN